MQWTSIPSGEGGGGGSNTPSHFMLQKPGYFPAEWAPYGSCATFLLAFGNKRLKGVLFFICSSLG